MAEKKHGTYEDIEQRRERQEQSRIQRRIEKRSQETKKVCGCKLSGLASGFCCNSPVCKHGGHNALT